MLIPAATSKTILLPEGKFLSLVAASADSVGYLTRKALLSGDPDLGRADISADTTLGPFEETRRFEFECEAGAFSYVIEDLAPAASELAALTATQIETLVRVADLQGVTTGEALVIGGDGTPVWQAGSSLNSTQVARLDSAQLSQLTQQTTTQIAHLQYLDVGGSLTSALAAKQNALTTTEIAALDSAQLAALLQRTTTEIAAFPTTSVNALTTTQVAALGIAAITTSTAIANATTTQIADLQAGGSALQVLRGSISGLPVWGLAPDLTIEQFSVLGGAHIAAIPTLALSSLTSGQVSSLNTSLGGKLLQNGWPSTTNMSLSFDSGTRTLTVTDSSGTLTFWSGGVKFTKSSPQTLQISTATGMHHVYFDTSGNLAELTTFSELLITTYAYTAAIYWNTSLAVLVGNELHGTEMDSATHIHLHRTHGTQYDSGLAITPTVVDGNGSLATHAQIGVATGVIRDEDLVLTIAAATAPATLPVMYRSGASGDWTFETNTDYPVLTTGTGRLAYNQFTAGAWQKTEVGNGNYVLYHIYATNDVSTPLKSVMGQNEYTTLSAACTGAETEAGTLSAGGIAFTEWRLIGTLIYHTSNTQGNAVKAHVTSTVDGASYVDWRLHAILQGVVSNNHNSLSGLQGGSANDYNHLTSVQIAALSALSSTQLASLTATAFAAIPSTAISGMTSVQMAAIPTTAIAGMTATQIAAVSTTALSGLTSAQVQALTTTALGGLTSTQIASITSIMLAPTNTGAVGALSTKASTGTSWATATYAVGAAPTETSVPVFSSNTNGTITLSESAPGASIFAAAWYALNNSTDGGFYAQLGSPATIWAIDFGSGKTARILTVTWETQDAVYGAKIFKIQGSNDNAAWADLFVTSNPGTWSANTPKTFTLTTTGVFRYYRIYMTESQGASNFRIDNLSFTFASTGVDVFSIPAGVVVGSPPGGSLGAGSLNAERLYDNDAILATCYAIELANQGFIEDEHWMTPMMVLPGTEAVLDPATGEVLVPAGEPQIVTGQNPGLMKFRERLGTEFDPMNIDTYIHHIRKKGHLTSLPNREKIDEFNRPSMGGWMGRVVEALDIIALHLAGLHWKQKQLEAGASLPYPTDGRKYIWNGTQWVVTPFIPQPFPFWVFNEATGMWENPNPKPFPSWGLSKTTGEWTAPIAIPDDGRQYVWSEEARTWNLA